MTDTSKVVIASLQDLLKQYSKSYVIRFLKKFKSTNEDVENFLHRLAVSFEEKGRSRTYLMINVSDEPSTIEAYISVTLKSIILDQNLDEQLILTEDVRVKTGIAQNENSFVTLLVAQFGKNQSEGITLISDAKDLLSYAWKISEDISYLTGGLRTLFVECEADNERLVGYYENLGFEKLQIKQRNNDQPLTQFFALMDQKMSFMEKEDE